MQISSTCKAKVQLNIQSYWLLIIQICAFLYLSLSACKRIIHPRCQHDRFSRFITFTYILLRPNQDGLGTKPQTVTILQFPKKSENHNHTCITVESNSTWTWKWNYCNYFSRPLKYLVAFIFRYFTYRRIGDVWTNAMLSNSER